MQRPPGVPGFARLAVHATPVTAFGVTLSVAPRPDLIAMKRAPASALDLPDLAYLEQTADDG